MNSKHANESLVIILKIHIICGLSDMFTLIGLLELLLWEQQHILVFLRLGSFISCWFLWYKKVGEEESRHPVGPSTSVGMSYVVG